MTIEIVDPTPKELLEFYKLENYASKLGYVFECERSFLGCAVSEGALIGKKSVSFRTVYHHSSPMIAAIRADIMCLVLCLRELGHEVSYLDETPKESPEITRTMINGMMSVGHIKRFLKDTPLIKKIEKEEERIKRESAKSGKIGRISKKQIVDLLFGEEKVEEPQKEVREPKRTGSDWARAKSEWSVERFEASNFTKNYKTRDEFITFADDADVFGF